MRTNSRTQRAKREERRQQRQSSRSAAQLRYWESIRPEQRTPLQTRRFSAVNSSRYRGTKERLDFWEDDSNLYGAIIKKYNDYVNQGLIKRQSGLNKYEAADWFSENVLTPQGMESAIRQVDEWRENAARIHAEKKEKRRRFYADFD